KRGQSFDGIVTGVTSIGVFVQIWPYLAEGLIHKSDLGRDAWDFDKDHGRLVGRRSGRAISLGQTVRVILARVDETRMELGFIPDDSAVMGQLPVASVQRGKRVKIRRRASEKPVLQQGRRRHR